MRCPACGSSNTAVVDSRSGQDDVRRRRSCQDCGRTFSTLEVVVVPDTCAKDAPQVRREFRRMMEREGQRIVAARLREVLGEFTDETGPINGGEQ